MRPGFVPTAAAKQAELDRQRREAEFYARPAMVAYDRVMHGGAMARDLAPPNKEEMAHMTQINDLKALLRQFTAEQQALYKTVQRWTRAPQTPGVPTDPNRPQGVSLSADDLGQHPQDYTERQLKAARAAAMSADVRHGVELGRMVAEAAKAPAARFEAGTKLDPAHLSEVGLYVEQYRGLTKQEQADLNVGAVKALEIGDLQDALAMKRAAVTLRIPTPELDVALVEADPERKAAKVELDYLNKLVETWRADVTKRHVESGMAAEGETVKAIDDPHSLGLSADAGPYVTQAIGA